MKESIDRNRGFHKFKMTFVSTESCGCIHMYSFRTKGRFYGVDLVEIVGLFLENIYIES